MQSRLIILIIMAISFFVTSCSQDGEIKKLKTYVNKVKSQQSTQIEPIPEVRKIEKFAYPNVKRRNPFHAVVKQNPNAITGPNQKREKQMLEQFALDSLKMVGSLTRDGEIWAIVSAPDGIFYRVSVGKYIGQHYGKITEVTEKVILVDELVQAEGGWRRRPMKLDLMEGS